MWGIGGRSQRRLTVTVRRRACEGLERITGVVNREPGQTMRTSADFPLWIEWLEKNKAKYQSEK